MGWAKNTGLWVRVRVPGRDVGEPGPCKRQSRGLDFRRVHARARRDFSSAKK